MVITVASMRMMQVAVHEIVNVIAVRDRGMTAVRSVYMLLVMTVAGMTVCALHRVCRVYIQLMLIDVAVMRMVQMAVVKKIDVITMLNGGMTAREGVLVGVVLVGRMLGVHGFFFRV